MLDLVVYLVVLSFVILHLSYVRERGRSSNLSKGCIVLNCRTMRNCMPDTVSVRDSATQVAAYVNGSGTALAHYSDMSLKGRAPCRHTIVVVPYMGQVRTGPEIVRASWVQIHRRTWSFSRIAEALLDAAVTMGGMDEAAVPGLLCCV